MPFKCQRSLTTHVIAEPLKVLSHLGGRLDWRCWENCCADVAILVFAFARVTSAGVFTDRLNQAFRPFSQCYRVMPEVTAEQFSQRLVDCNLLDLRQLDRVFGDLGSRHVEIEKSLTVPLALHPEAIHGSEDRSEERLEPRHAAKAAITDPAIDHGDR